MMEVPSPLVEQTNAVKYSGESYPPLPTQGTTPAGNTSGLQTLLLVSSYESEWPTPLLLIMLGTRGGRSSYGRVMIELRADMELKDNIVVAMPKNNEEVECPSNPDLGRSCATKKRSYQQLLKKIKKFENLVIDGQAILVDEAGNPLKKVEYPDHDEVALVDNDMARSLASERTGFGTESVLEQWKGFLIVYTVSSRKLRGNYLLPLA
ncbi:hypothetical protein Tco_0485048 [Tanacetum coccineum]